MKQRVRLADQPTFRTWLSLYTPDNRRLYPGYLIWGRSDSRLALAAVLYFLRPRQKVEDNPEPNGLLPFAPPGSPLAIIGILASIGVLIDASGKCV
jgi:hypothetical protein